MQRTFVAIALALTLSCAFASTITTQNYVKNPQNVLQDNETAFTNSSDILLAGVNTNELDIVASSTVAPPVDSSNQSNYTWNTIYRKIDGKALTATGNTTLNFTGSLTVYYVNGYVISISNESDANGTQQVTASQKSISGGNVLAKVSLSANTYANYTPNVLATQVIGKNVYVFFLANNTNSTPTQVNVTSFTAGTTTKGTNFNLTTTYGANLTVAWGEALGSNQLYVNWNEGPVDARVLKYATVDVSKGTVTTNTTDAYLPNYICRAFSTDKKWYGDFCAVTSNVLNTTDNTTLYVAINYYVRFNSTKLIPFNPIVNTTLHADTSAVNQVFPYAAGLAVIYKDSVTTANTNTFSYELWNLDTLTTTKNKTTFLTTDYKTEFYRIPSAGVYTLTYQYQNSNTTLTRYTSVQVGQVLSGSYLTSVLGFIMTIVAGVLLF